MAFWTDGIHRLSSTHGHCHPRNTGKPAERKAWAEMLLEMPLVTKAQFLCTRVHQFPLAGAIVSQGSLSPSPHKMLRGTLGGGHPDLDLNPSIASCLEDAHSVTSLSLSLSHSKLTQTRLLRLFPNPSLS